MGRKPLLLLPRILLVEGSRLHKVETCARLLSVCFDIFLNGHVIITTVRITGNGRTDCSSFTSRTAVKRCFRRPAVLVSMETEHIRIAADNLRLTDFSLIDSFIHSVSVCCACKAKASADGKQKQRQRQLPPVLVGLSCVYASILCTSEP